jgi:Spy/CpxP family protein refolding chaperone
LKTHLRILNLITGGKNMKRTLSIVGILLVAGVVSVSLIAQDTAWGRGRGGQGYWGGPGSCWDSGRGPAAATELTEEQKTQLDELYQAHYDETVPIKNDLWAKRAQMRTLLGASTVDKEQILSLQREINALKSTLAEKRIEFRLKARDIAPDYKFAGGYGKGYGFRGRGEGPNMRGYGPHMRGGYGPGWRGGNAGGYGPGACWQ